MFQDVHHCVEIHYPETSASSGSSQSSENTYVSKHVFTSTLSIEEHELARPLLPMPYTALQTLEPSTLKLLSSPHSFCSSSFTYQWLALPRLIMVLGAVKSDVMDPTLPASLVEKYCRIIVSPGNGFHNFPDHRALTSKGYFELECCWLASDCLLGHGAWVEGEDFEWGLSRV